MSEFIQGFSPKPRVGEIIPSIPPGKAATRLHGKIVFVSEHGSDPLVGRSAYTQRQLDELSRLNIQGAARRKRSQTPTGAW